MAPEEFRNAILQKGAVFLPNRADPGLLDKIHRELNRLFASYPDLSDEQLAVSDPSTREQIDLSHVSERTFSTFAGFSYYEVLRQSGLWEMVQKALPETQPEESPFCHSRRVATPDRKEFFSWVIDYHVDAQFHWAHQLNINFWTPLVACGKAAPGISVIPIGLERSKGYLEFNPTGRYEFEHQEFNQSKFRVSKMRTEILSEQGLLASAWSPEFEMGDVLAFSNFTMHCTYYRPEMTEPRTSVELRVELPGFPI